MDPVPSVIVLGGPNGAGKSTFSTQLFSTWPGRMHYVNADVISRGLSAFHSEDMAFEAGRITLDHLKRLSKQRLNMAFETTLATRSFAPWISELKRDGYRFGLFFLWLPSSEMAVMRVHRGKNPEDTSYRTKRFAVDT